MKRRRILAACLLLAVAWGASLAHAQSAGDVDAPAQKQKDNGKKNQKKPDEKPDETSNKLPPYTGPKKRIAVMDLEVKVTANSAAPAPSGGAPPSLTVDIPLPTDFGTGMTEMLTTSLVDTNRFLLLERKSLKDIQDEQALGKTEAVDQTSSAKSGKILGAQLLVRGAITEFSYKKAGTGAGGVFGKTLDIGKSTGEASVVIDIRLYDAATGLIFDSVKAEGHAKSSSTNFSFNKGDIKLGSSSFNSTPLGHATREAIDRAVKFIVERMQTLPWESRVAELDQENGKVSVLYITGGSSVGIKVGDELEVLHPGRPIIDPDTRVVISRTKDKMVGRCRIETVDKSLATAKPITGEGFQIGDVVRFPTPDAAK